MASHRSSNAGSDITQLLNRLGVGDEAAEREAWDIVYPEMVRLARSERRRWEGQWTLETRVLANEAYVKLFPDGRPDYADRGHFYRLVSRAVRQVLLDYAKARTAKKRGSGIEPETLGGDELAGGDADLFEMSDQVVALHEALERFRSIDERGADIVELRFFGGLSMKEIAEVLDVSVATVGRDWALARAWLARELGA